MNLFKNYLVSNHTWLITNNEKKKKTLMYVFTNLTSRIVQKAAR